MGTVPNVGLMAQQAEENTARTTRPLNRAEDGIANIVDNATGEVLLTQNVEPATSGACARSGRPIRDWVSWPSPVPQSGMPAVFWLDPYRPHETI